MAVELLSEEQLAFLRAVQPTLPDAPLLVEVQAALRQADAAADSCGLEEVARMMRETARAIRQALGDAARPLH